jgi:LysM repeat protein
MFQYIIQPGDNLYRIADRFDVTVAAIIAANPGLYPQQIFPGQVILIPISGYLYQNYPWYYLLPYLFLRFPRQHWDDRSQWPRDWQDRDFRRFRITSVGIDVSKGKGMVCILKPYAEVLASPYKVMHTV